MRAIVFGILTLFGVAFGEVLQCNAIFEERKAELQNELKKIAEQKKMMNILYDEQKRANEGRLEQLRVQEARVQALIDEAKAREEAIKKLIAQNEDLLAQIDEKKNAKITQTYAKMKDSKAGAIIEAMPLPQAAEILFTMDAKSVGKILAKMEVEKAAKITEMLKKGPPFMGEE